MWSQGNPGIINVHIHIPLAPTVPWARSFPWVRPFPWVKPLIHSICVCVSVHVMRCMIKCIPTSPCNYFVGPWSLLLLYLSTSVSQSRVLYSLKFSRGKYFVGFFFSNKICSKSKLLIKFLWSSFQPHIAAVMNLKIIVGETFHRHAQTH